MSSIGILAYGSLIQDPGSEISPIVDRRIRTQTPFPVEYGRISKTRGGAPTVVPHPSGVTVAAEVLVLRSEATLDQAKDFLWRRETRQSGKGHYAEGSSPDGVLVRDLPSFQGLDHVLYTDFPTAGKIKTPNALSLARAAVASVRAAKVGKDGVSYLMDLIAAGVQTALTPAYRTEILRSTKAKDLLQAIALKQSGKLAVCLKSRLRQQAGRDFDSSGYCSCIEKNLLPDVGLQDFEQDLRAGAGQELESKFLAAYSSSALAVNTFAPFKRRPDDLRIADEYGFSAPMFERELSTGLGGTSPHLDVVLDQGARTWAIESKLLEYFTPKKAKFSSSYTRTALPWAEDCWWQVKEDAEAAGKRFLDVAQLVKHYFGICRLLHDGAAQSAALLYLFWEPIDAKDIAVCRQHRAETAEFAAAVVNSRVEFRSMSYSELWAQWLNHPSLQPHARNLTARYGVSVGE